MTQSQGHHSRCLIDRQLKTLTSKPTEHRVVTIANFTAFLSNRMNVTEKYVTLYH